MENEKRNNEEEEFIVSFEDEAVDMTDINRVSRNNAGGYSTDGRYGTGGNTTANLGAGNSYAGTGGAYDPYGVYQPNQTNQTAQAKQAEEYIKKRENVMTVLVYAAMALQIGYFTYFVISKNYDFNLFDKSSKIVGIIIAVIFIMDAIFMYKRYKRNSLLITALLFPIGYPFARNSARDERKSISVLWLLAVILSCSLFLKGGAYDLAISMNADKEGKEIYLSMYDKPMKKFKSYKYDGKIKTSNVINEWFTDYEIDVVNEEDGYLNVKIAGDTTTTMYKYGSSEVVTTKGAQSPNTVMNFKVNKKDGSFEVTGMQLNGEAYNSDAKGLWEYWCQNSMGKKK